MSTNTEEFIRFKGGIDANDLTKITYIDHEETFIIAQTKYYSVEDLKVFLDKHSNKLTILSLNVDSELKI